MKDDVEVPVVARDPREGVPDLSLGPFEQLHEGFATAKKRTRHVVARVAAARVEEDPRECCLVVAEGLRGIDDAQETQKTLRALAGQD
jgi:hypothetical protein